MKKTISFSMPEEVISAIESHTPAGRNRSEFLSLLVQRHLVRQELYVKRIQNEFSAEEVAWLVERSKGNMSALENVRAWVSYGLKSLAFDPVFDTLSAGDRHGVDCEALSKKVDSLDYSFKIAVLEYLDFLCAMDVKDSKDFILSNHSRLL